MEDGKQILFRQVGRDVYHNTWHTIGRNMIIYIHRGKGRLVCSEKSYPIAEGVLCFVGAQKFHYTLSDDPSCYERSKVFLNEEELRRVLPLFAKSEKFHKIFHPDALVYAQLSGEDALQARRLLEEMEKSSTGERYSEAVFLADYARLLVLLEQNKLESIAPSVGHIYKAIEYINAHITENLQMDEICAAVPISKYYFCREFKKAMGMTAMEYILKTRITLAQEMLLKEKLSVSEISESCGFSSISYFCRSFRKETGMTPLAYRKNG